MRVVPMAPAGLVVLLLVLFPQAALADAIGGPCPSGQVYVTNPTEPGAMHHAGGQCVDDPNASHGCAASAGHASTAPLVLLGGAAAVWWSRRSRIV